MKERIAYTPPRLPQRFLQWFCKPELLEDIEGDIEEDFNERCNDLSPFKARLHYWLDVLRFLKPFAIRRFTTQTNNIMLKNYFKTSVRVMARNRLFSAINIIGLTLSMSVCIAVITFLMEIRSHDAFHADADRIYRIVSEEQYMQRDPELVAATSILAGKRLKAEVPGIDAIVTMNRRFGGKASFQDQSLPLKGLWASSGFFEVFKAFPLLRGNPATALSSPNSLVLTQETALRLFGETDPLNQTVIFNEDELFTVTGIINKPPHNSHFSFEALGSMVTYENNIKQRLGNDKWLSWTSVGNDYVYTLLAENTDPAQIQSALLDMSEEENKKSKNLKITAQLQPLLDIIAGPKMFNNIGKSIDLEMLWGLSILAMIVIVSAGFNYTNLSIARSLRRTKEVGVRKAIGARRSQVFAQFIVEATLISLVSLGFAVLLFYAIRPEFLNLVPGIEQIFTLNTSPTLFVYFLAFGIMVGILAGWFPAVFLSKLKASNVIRGTVSTRLFRQVHLRKALITVQFTFSLLFIISASIAVKQYNYALSFDLGFKTDNVLNIPLLGNDAELLSNAFAAIPGVEAISKSSSINAIGGSDGTRVKFEDPNDSSRMSYNLVDENYIPLMKHRLLAGTNFESRLEQKVEEFVILNESTVKRFDMGSPNDAIGRFIQFSSGEKLKIIGVVEDFVYSDINNNISNFGFRYVPGAYQFLNLKISSQNPRATVDQLAEVWRSFDQANDFQPYFYDSLLQTTYSLYSVIYKVVGFLSIIAISISVLGLLGMGVYTAETRLKEVCIRKILGASEKNLVMLLAKGFIWLLIIASAIAIPASYFIFDSVVLANTANKASIGFLELVSGALVIFAVGFITIGSQTWKAARSNPAQNLRSE